MFNTIFLTFRPPNPSDVCKHLSSDKIHSHAIFPFKPSTSFIVPQSSTQKTPCPLSELSHPRTNVFQGKTKSLKYPQNICRPFGCRLVGHCIAYEWAIHTTNTELLSAEHFPNAIKPSSKRHQTILETPPNHP